MSTWATLRNRPELWSRYFIREQVLAATRRFFQDRSFHEVETPILIANPPAESYLEIFETKLLDRHRKSTSAYLATSPEAALKKLLVAGIGNCFALTKSFRNTETNSRLHNPEFTILEWYRTPATYLDIMDECEELVVFINTYLQRMNNQDSSRKPTELVYQGKVVNIARPWHRISVSEAFAQWAKVDFNTFLDEKLARVIAQRKGYSVEEKTTWEELYNQIFLNEVEHHLGRGKPTILYDFPGNMAALAKKNPDDPRYAQRFEFYIEGLELGDCYSELTDANEQQARFESELAEIKRLGKTVYDYDTELIRALGVGLPECSGIAVGMDRLIMLFADVADIADTMFFPARDLFDAKL
jgi:elongation factor P--(R)-beta-lysine ligase